MKKFVEVRGTGDMNVVIKSKFLCDKIGLMAGITERATH